MSADNGVYILVTNRGRGKREYRVTHCQCIDNLDYEKNFPRHNPQVNLEEMLSYFGKSKVFTDRRIAEGYAIALEERQLEGPFGICEYGIVWLEYPTIRFPKSEYDPDTEASYREEAEREFSEFQDRCWAERGF